jgi:hypothetical protein
LGGLRRELKSRILSEKSLDFLIGSIDHVQSKEDALYFVKQAIPCILHLENQTLLKLFCLSLHEGLANAQGRLLSQTELIASMSEREAKFIEAISKVMNEEILGTLENKGQWKLPTKSARGENLMIGTINIENYRGRRIMENFDKIQQWSYYDKNRTTRLKISAIFKL